MFAIDTLLFGLVGGIIGVKLAMLAAAAVMFVYGVTARAKQARTAPARATSPTAKTRHKRLRAILS